MRIREVQRIAKISEKFPDKVARGALWALAEYVDRARVEFDRIQNGQMLYLQLIKEGSSDGEKRMEAGTALSCDVHYLMICLDKIQVMLNLLNRHLPIKKKVLKPVMMPMENWSKRYDEVRNYLEHIDQRIERGEPVNGTITEKSYDIGPYHVKIDKSAKDEMSELLDDLLSVLENETGIGS